MLRPSIFGESFLNDWNDWDNWMNFSFPDVEKKLYGKHAAHVMKTDIKEHDDGYELVVDLPGFNKEDIKMNIEDGYLVINAKTSNEEDNTDKNGKYVRKERYYGECSRSFYIGDNITEEDIKANYKNGTLNVEIPKKEELEKIKDKKYIEIGE